MKKITLLSLFIFPFFIANAQDSNLLGRFGITGFGAYSKSNIGEEIAKGGFGGEFRYFPNPKSAIVVALQNLNSEIYRNNEQNFASNYSIGIGYEKYFPIGKFSPYIGQEMGLNFTNVKSELITFLPNINNFTNNLPSVLIKPKIGLHFNINNNVIVQLQGSFNWTFSTDRQNTNPLFDEKYLPIYFGRKTGSLSIGIMYLFDE